MTKHKIKNVLIDPNGLCNAKCWFCPVAYAGNPVIGKSNMSIETMEDIFKQLHEGIGDFVSPEIKFWPFHFNETLLYPQFEEMLKLYSKYNFKMALFSNGVNLTVEKINIILKYPETIDRIVLNIPSAFEEEWAQFTGFNIKLFNKLINNLKYLEENKKFLKNTFIMIQVNGVNDNSLYKNNGSMKLLANNLNIDLDMENGSNAKTVKYFKEKFTKFAITKDVNLSDRVNVLQKLNVFSNQEYIKSQDKTKIVGCELERDIDWLHISSKGDIFLCCEDFNFETICTNIKDKTIKEIWYSEERKNMIQDSFNGFCKNCVRAIWE